MLREIFVLWSSLTAVKFIGSIGFHAIEFVLVCQRRSKFLSLKSKKKKMLLHMKRMSEASFNYIPSWEFSSLQKTCGYHKWICGYRCKKKRNPLTVLEKAMECLQQIVLHKFKVESIYTQKMSPIYQALQD